MKGKFSVAKKKEWLFYALMAALPILQFIIFYVVVNANSLVLAFKSYDRDTNVYGWVGFDNFAAIIKSFRFDDVMRSSAINSLILYATNLLVSVPLSLIFSYYIYKKMWFSRFFNVILFLPSIISSIIMSMIFQNFVDNAIPEFILKISGKMVGGLISTSEYTFGTILFYNVWVGFGISVLLYSGAMSGIDNSLIEAAKLDGATSLSEFWHVVLSSIFPTITTFLVVGIAGIFTNQMALFNFFGGEAPNSLSTFGYYMFVKVEDANIAQFPRLSALGILMTVVAVPITFVVKYLLEKFGPKTD